MSVAQDWESRRLTVLAEYINGYAFKPEDWGKDGLPIIRIEQLKNPESISDYFSGRLPEHNIIDNNDLIFSWSASLFLSIWKNGKAALNQHLFKVIEKEGVDRHFLKQFIEFHLPEITKVSHGSTMQHVTRKELDRFCAPFPCSKPEQTKIAEILSTVDQAIDQTESLIAKRQRIKTGLMQDLLTRGIDKDGNLRSEDTHKFKDSSLGRIPVEWEVRRLEELTEKIVDGVHRTPTYVDSGIPFIVVTDLTKGLEICYSDTRLISERDHKEFFKRADPRTGDVLVTKDGTLGVARIVGKNAPPFSIFVSVAMLRARAELCLPELIWSFFDSGQFLRQLGALSAGTGLAHIHLEHFRKFLLRRPPIQEQHMIFKILTEHGLLLQKELLGSAKLRRQKTALMQDLLTGNVRVIPFLTELEICE